MFRKVRPTVCSLRLSKKKWFLKIQNKFIQSRFFCFILANIVNSQIPIANEVIPLLNTLTNLTNESSHLSILEGYEVVYLQSKEGGFFSESKIQQGTRRSAFKCAAGLVILAFNNDPMPQKRHAAYLLSASKNFHDEKFQQIRKNIQHKGYAITTRGNDEKEVEIAAPVKNEQQKVIAALSVTAPMSRIAAIPVQKRIIRLLETEANKLHQIIRLRKRSAKYAKQ